MSWVRACWATSRSAAPNGLSRMGGPPAFRAGSPQDGEFEFGRDAARQGQFERRLQAGQMAVPLLEGDHSPAQMGDGLPVADRLVVDLDTALGLVPPVKRPARRDAARPQLRLPEAPALGAKPADVRHRIAPPGELPVENGG